MQEAQNKLEQSFALMGNDLGYIKRDISEIKTTLKELGTTFVTRPEHVDVLNVQKDHEARVRGIEDILQDYALVKKIVFGAVTLILLAVLSSVIYIVIPK